MKKLIFAFLVILLASCVRQDDIKLNRFVALRPIDLSSGELVVNVTNNSRHALTITNMKFVFEDNGKRFAEVIIASPVVVAKRFSGDVTIPLRIRITDPFSALGSVKRISEGNVSVVVSGEGSAKVGSFSKSMKFAPMPVVNYLKGAGVDPSKFIDSFGL